MKQNYKKIVYRKIGNVLLSPRVYRNKLNELKLDYRIEKMKYDKKWFKDFITPFWYESFDNWLFDNYEETYWKAYQGFNCSYVILYKLV